MVIGSAKASLRIFEGRGAAEAKDPSERNGPLPDPATQPLVGENAPIRQNKCISAPAPGFLAPLVFGGAAVGVRPWRGGGDDAAGAGLGTAVVAEFS